MHPPLADNDTTLTLLVVATLATAWWSHPALVVLWACLLFATWVCDMLWCGSYTWAILLGRVNLIVQVFWHAYPVAPVL
jgi:hypothetical protein